MREICHMVTERSLKWKIRGKKIFHSRNCRRCAYKHYFGDFTAIILFQDRQYLADQLKISGKFLYEIENGRKGFTVQILNNLATIFGTTCDYLVRGEGPSTVEEVKKPEPEKRIDKVLKLFDGEEQDMIGIVLRTVYAVREKGEKKDPSSEE